MKQTANRRLRYLFNSRFIIATTEIHCLQVTVSLTAHMFIRLVTVGLKEDFCY